MRKRIASSGFLLAALGAAVLGLGLVELTKTSVPYPMDRVQLDAARRMAAAESRLAEILEARGIPAESELDINRTGLIGPEWTPLTTTVGNLEAKRSILNPNFAALMVRLYREAGLEAGDRVAIGASGSFPGLIIASLCAADALGLKAVTIASFGASMYGGTRPEFSSPEMIATLEREGLVSRSLAAVSPGANEDHGESPLFGDSRAIIAAAARSLDAEFIDFDPPDLGSSIRRRLEIYQAEAGSRGIACFVNIGGASANFGSLAASNEVPQGLSLRVQRIPDSPERGLMFEYAARGLPVINLLNVRSLAQAYGLPWDPVPLPKPGEGGVYFRTVHSRPLAAAALLVCLGILAAGGRARRRGLAEERQAQAKRLDRGGEPG